jgi:hypothetical protein
MAAQKALIIGLSGTGKSTSLRNLKPENCAVVNPVGKPLPFKGGNKFTMLNGEIDSGKICRWIREQVKEGKKIIVVDDFQYLLSIPYMNRIHENGWDKWNDFGADYFAIIDICTELPDDVRVYYLSHCETLEDGTTTIKLIGKLLREKITIEGLFTTVLKTSVIDGKYYFLTQNSGRDTVKSPMGMFPDYAIDNDLAYVDDKICNYYEVGDFKSDAEMEKADEAAGDSSIAKPNAGRRPRGSAEPKKEKRTREEIQKENDEKVAEFAKEQDEALAEIADGREEIPWDEAEEATKGIEAPELEKLPRKTREPKETPDFEGMNPPEKKPRGRKAREIEAQGNPEDIKETEETTETAEEKAPTRRRRTR